MTLDTTLLAETPEGIGILLRPAGAVSRSLAYALDFFIRFVVFSVTAAFLGGVKGVGVGIILIVYFGLEWLYPIVFELLPGAATPGKRVLGLQVMMDTGLPVTPSAAVTRNLLRVADFMPIAFAFGLLSMLLRRDFKRLGDIVAGTLVVHAEQVRLAGALPDVEPLAPRVPLTRAQQIAILHLAGRARRLTLERVDELATLAEAGLPPPDYEPGGASPAPIRPGPRLTGVAQWLMGQR
ncbi:MAG: RDD family protein [Burkholderiaceae bacterium]